jgi:two-component system, cell cycle sensor histidine kinase and response regulator CckA
MLFQPETTGLASTDGFQMRSKWQEFWTLTSTESALEDRAGHNIPGHNEVLRELVHNLPIGFFALDNESGQFLHVNPAFERIVGYSYDECLHLNYLHVVAPEDRERVREFRSRRMRGDPTLPGSYEMLVQTRAGERRVVQFYVNPIHFDDIIFGALLDITVEKLQVDPLRHMQRMDSLATLAGGMAGEFNNLLAAIDGYAQLAISRLSQGTDAQPALLHIRSATKRARDHVQSLLTFASAGSNAMASVDLHVCISTLLVVLPSTAKYPFSLKHDLSEPDSGRVRCDSTQIEQSILNVLINAVEALPKDGSGAVSVSLHLSRLLAGNEFHLPEGYFYKITVEDSGEGIKPENQPKVLQPFFTTRKKDMNPGLGLSTANSIIHDHGGALFIDSIYGKGTTVTILLPREKDLDKLVPVRTDSKQKPIDLSPTKIMVVDDQEFVAELIRDVLEESGHEVDIQTSAILAFDKLRSLENVPSLLIVDIMMPDMDGRTFIRRLRNEGCNIPVIFTSGYAPPDENDRELAASTIGFLSKPFSNRDLIELVRLAIHTNATGGSD